MSETTHAEVEEQDKDIVHIKESLHDIDIIINYTDRIVRIDGDIQTGDFNDLVNEIAAYSRWEGFYKVN
jgi:ABC-type phosphate/phosphonate transport system ATPase subunit